MRLDYSIYLEEAVEIYENQSVKSIVKVAEFLYDKYKIKAKFDSFRRTLSDHLKKSNLIKVKNSAKKTYKPIVKKEDPKPFVLSAWNNKTGLMMDIDEYCEFYKLPRKDIQSYKLVSHTGTPFYNILFKENIEFTKDLTEDFIEAAIKKLIKPVKLPVFKAIKTKFCLRVIYTDAHIAMETNANGFGLYGGVWNAQQLFYRKDEIIKAINEAFEMFGAFDEIHIIDLGDLMDGWDALTVRGGHDLPQNMDNETAFDVGLKFKTDLISEIVTLNITDTIKSYNVCNDNHSGSFGYSVNSAAKKFLEGMYVGLVQVFNFRKFISHYNYGKHCFIISHGKDAKSLKFGFKPHIDTKGEDKIEEYIKVNKLLHTDSFITFEKGDSHQKLFDFCTSDDYDYFNYMALSPSSEWIQTNFKRGRSGFELMLINKDAKRKIMMPTEFEWIEGKLLKTA